MLRKFVGISTFLPKRLLRTIECVLLLGASVAAQSELATLTGTVKDPSGAVIPRVEITVTNEATNISTVALTNEDGRYFVRSLRPGTYTVSASLPGFRKFVNSGVTLQVNQTARLDITLTVGEVSQEVLVSAEASLLESETSNRGAVID